MYLHYFGVAEAPFSIAPDPRYLFMSPKHREALAHLLYGVKSDNGFVVLTGEVGAGKTTVCRCLLEQLPAQCDLALIFNPALSALELLASICEEFRIPVPESPPGTKVYIDRLNAWLLAAHAQGRMAVVVVDEAQGLAPEVLEQLRLLTNLETNQRKLLRIVLLGQPQLRDLLDRPDMLQLSQRIVARYHLGPLSWGDTRAYIEHRLAVAGARHPLFTTMALACLYRLSGGIPRRLNILADRALLGAYVRGRATVDGGLVRRAQQEISGQARGGWPRFAVASALGFSLLGGAAALWPQVRHDPSAFAPPQAQAARATQGALALPAALAVPGRPRRGSKNKGE